MTLSPALLMDSARDVREGARALEGRNDRSEFHLLYQVMKACIAALRMVGIQDPLMRDLIIQARGGQRDLEEDRDGPPLPIEIRLTRRSANDLLAHAIDRLSEIPEESR